MRLEGGRWLSRPAAVVATVSLLLSGTAGTASGAPDIGSAGSGLVSPVQTAASDLPPALLPPQSLARVAVEGTRLRSRPSLSAEILRTLPAGELVILDAPDGTKPAVVDDATWYQVLWIEGYGGGALPHDPPVSTQGWVAFQPNQARPLVYALQACPSSLTVDQLLAVPAYDLLACFGSRELTFRGRVVQGLGGDPGATYEPGWLAGPFAIAVALTSSDGYHNLIVKAEPDLKFSLPTDPFESIGGWVEVSARMDHPASSQCTVTYDGAGGWGPELPWDLSPLADDWAELWCREQMVASDIHTVSGPAVPPDTAFASASQWPFAGWLLLLGSLCASFLLFRAASGNRRGSSAS